jgi:hypothetical protein
LGLFSIESLDPVFNLFFFQIERICDFLPGSALLAHLEYDPLH